MIQQGQVFKLRTKAPDGQSLWAYRYRIEGRGSERPQVGGFATRVEAEKALRKVLDRLGPGGGRATITLVEFVDEYLEMHQAAPVTIAKLRWLLGKATAELGEKRLADLSPREVYAWRFSVPEGHRFEATQALRQVLNRAVCWGLLDYNPAKLGVPNPPRRAKEKRPFETWRQIEAVAARLGPASPCLRPDCVPVSRSRRLAKGEAMSAEQPHKTVAVRGNQRRTSLLVDASAVMVTLGAAAACWLIALSRMKGMDMGGATTLGSFSFFVVAWVSMMAAMMLPGALPAVLRNELTPLKAGCRRQCRADRSGLGLGVYCVGSSGGLMLLFLAVGAMSITWMCVVAVLVMAQKLLPPRAVVNAPVALAIIGLGVAMLVAPFSIPDLMPPM